MGDYNFPMRPVWEHYSETPLPLADGKFKVLCVLHSENRPSAQVNLFKNTFNCFVCDVFGDAIDLIKAKEGVDTATAISIAEELTGQPVGEVSSGSQVRRRGKPASLFTGATPADGENAQRVSSGRRGRPKGLRR